MKNRRLTIFCVALVALAGTPRAWQEAGKLLAAVQHKAQVKFWSMVIQPKTRESAGIELVAQAEPFEINAASLDSNCPLEVKAPRSQQARSNSQGSKAVSALSQPQQRAQQKTGVAPLSHAGLIAKALKAPRGDSNADSLRHSRSYTFDARLTEVIESHPSLLAFNGKQRAPLPPAGKGDTYSFVVIPAVSPAVATTLMEKENLLRLKVLRKAIEEPKTIRQKTRLPAVRGTATYFPAS